MVFQEDHVVAAHMGECLQHSHSLEDLGRAFCAVESYLGRVMGPVWKVKVEELQEKISELSQT